MLRKQLAAGSLDRSRAELALTDLAALPLQRAPHLPLLSRCWELRGNLSVYDAAYVALAEALEVPLLTSDRRLAQSADRGAGSTSSTSVRRQCRGIPPRPGNHAEGRTQRCSSFTGLPTERRWREASPKSGQAAGRPFAREIVAVPAKGVERWLASSGSPTCSGRPTATGSAPSGVPWPSTMLDEALQAVSQEHAEAVEQSGSASELWPLFEVIDESIPSEPWCRSLAQRLGTTDNDKGRRLAVARRLAHLFDEYGQSRPEMLRAWATSDDQRGDGTPLHDDLTLAGRAVAPATRPHRPAVRRYFFFFFAYLVGLQYCSSWNR